MPVTTRELLKDPAFQAAPVEERRKRLSAIDPKFAAFAPDAQTRILAKFEAGNNQKQAANKVAQEPFLDRVGTDLSLGFRSGVADLAHTGSNILGMVPVDSVRQAGKEMRAAGDAQAPTAAELKGRDSIFDAVAMGVGGAPPSLLKYAPAALSGRWAPAVAALTGAAGKADEGFEAAAKAGVRDAVSFTLIDKASAIPHRAVRAAASAGAAALPTAIESGGDLKATATAAIVGGTVGGLSKASPRGITAAQARQALKGGLDSANAFKDSILSVFSPMSLSHEAARTSRIMMARLAEVMQSSDRADFALQEAHKHFTKLPAQEQIDFVYRMQHAQPHLDANGKVDPKLTTFGQTMRKILDDKRDEVRAETKALQKFYVNYFPQMWKDPKKAAGFVQNWYAGRRPLPGPRGFQHERVHPDIYDGLKYGLEPVSTNPVDLVMLKHRELDRFLMAHRVVKELKDAGMAKFVPARNKGHAGYTKVNDSVFNEVVTIPGVGRFRGSWHIPDGAAQVINNHLSPGWRSNPLFRGLLQTNNFVNQAQLGVSAFHLGFTSVDAMTSQWAVGTKHVARGVSNLSPTGVAKGLFEMGKTPIAAFSNAFRGHNMMQEWNKPSSTGNPRLAYLVEMMKQGGGRAHLDPLYRNRMVDRMNQSFRDNKILKGSLQAPFAVVEKFSNAIMEHVVPWQKMGVFAKMAEFELEHLPPGAPQDQVRKAMARAWSSTDNRMGQMVYDNQFWNHYAKDLAQISIRSVGWNVGTFKELIGGGVVDTAKFAGKIATGKFKQAEFTHRMAYVAALPVVVGAIGGMMDYWMTDGAPRELKDYFFPRVGRKDEFGREERISIPAYIKDIYHYAHDPVPAATAKVTSMFWTVSEMLANEDFYKVKIANEDDPLTQQIWDHMKFGMSALVPFSVKQFERQQELGYPVGEQLAAAGGFIPAPSYIKKSEAEVVMDKMLQGKLSKGSRTRQEAERQEAIRDIERKVRTKADPGPAIDKAVAENKILPKDIGTAMNRASSNPMERGFKQLSLDQAVKVYSLASPAERYQLWILLKNKADLHAQELDLMPEKKRNKVSADLFKFLSEVPDAPPGR